MNPIRAIDLFCGAGGSSWGARLAGVEIVAGFDSWGAAKNAFTQNFPNAMFFDGQIEDLRPASIKRQVGKIDLILASPECRSHSPARGSGKRCSRSKRTAFEIVRFAGVLKPRWIIIENVVSMRNWNGYAMFKRALEDLGYNVAEQVLNAADFGVPQRRRRLFLLCDTHGKPRNVLPTNTADVPASKIIDKKGLHSVSLLRAKSRAPATLERAERAFAALGTRRNFLIVYYGSDGAGGWQSLAKPLRTITTLDRFALVRPARTGHVMRMLQVKELKQAMGMPQIFNVGNGPRRERIHLIGNAVCPPVMRAVVRTVTSSPIKSDPSPAPRRRPRELSV